MFLFAIFARIWGAIKPETKETQDFLQVLKETKEKLKEMRRKKRP